MQEFYAWLVRHEQGSTDLAYWPPTIAQDGNNLHVNPPEGECNAQAQMPFLWWGVRLSNPQGHNQVTTGALVGHVQPFLVPHLEPFHREQRRRQHLMDAANVGRKAIIDVVLDMIPGLGLIKTAGEAGLELKGIHDEWRKDQQAVSADERRASLAEEVVADLAKLFNSPVGRRVPAVIVIDDAQFSTFDQGMVLFVQALLAAATEGKWPLLLLVTHWQREWHESGSGASLASALQSAPHGTVRTITLEPIADLTATLLARLPGLPPEQTAAILERVGGNPRFLDEVLRLLELHGKGAFVGRDPAAPLTNTALHELLAATVGLHELVRLRLTQSPEEVQKAVVLAGIQGHEFLGSLVTSTAAELESTAPDEGGTELTALAGAVAAAEQTHSYFASTYPGLGAFVQPIYREVAGQRLGFWYDPDQATQALERAVKNTLAANPVMELQQILALYDVAVRLFENAEADADRAIALRGLDWLAHYAESTHDMHSVHSLALRMARLIATFGPDQVQHAAPHLSSTDRLLSLFGELEARGEVLRLLEQVTGSAVAADANPHSLAAHARAMASVADLRSATGDREGARSAWQAAHSAAQRLEQPDTPRVESNELPLLELRCEIERRHANWRFSVSEFLAAEDGFRAALGMLDKLQTPERPYWAERQTCLLGLAKCHWAANRLNEAESLMRATLDLARKFYEQEPGFASGNALAGVLDSLAQLIVVRAGGPVNESVNLLREALEISRGHAQALPGVLWPMDEVATKLERLAWAAGLGGNPDEAWLAISEAVALRRMAPSSGAPGPERWRLAVALYRATDIALLKGEPDAAREHAHAALSLLKAEMDAGTVGQLEAAFYILSIVALAAPIELDRGDYESARTLLGEADKLDGILPGAIPVERVTPLWQRVAECKARMPLMGD